jgi:hypothetical protein
MLTILMLSLTVCVLASTGYAYSELVAFDTLDPDVELISPADGQFYPAGAVLGIVWNAEDDNFVPSSVRIDISYAAAQEFSALANALPASGSYAWQSPADTLLYAIFRVAALDSFGNEGSSQNALPIIIGPMIPAIPQNLSLSPREQLICC